MFDQTNYCTKMDKNLFEAPKHMRLSIVVKMCVKFVNDQRKVFVGEGYEVVTLTVGHGDTEISHKFSCYCWLYGATIHLVLETPLVGVRQAYGALTASTCWCCMNSIARHLMSDCSSVQDFALPFEG